MLKRCQKTVKIDHISFTQNTQLFTPRYILDIVLDLNAEIFLNRILKFLGYAPGGNSVSKFLELITSRQ